MKTVVCGLCLIWATETVLASNWQGHVGVATDYSFRGLLQTHDGAAVEARLEYVHQSGFYFGAWAGRVDLNNHGQRDQELDYFAGYQTQLKHDVNLDTAIIRYTYPDADGPVDYDWTQWVINLHLGERLSLGLGADDNWLGRDKTSHFVDISYRHPLPLKLSVDVTGSYQHVDDLIGNNYLYYELGLSRPVGQIQARIALVGNDANGRKLFGSAADTRVIGSLSWLF